MVYWGDFVASLPQLSVASLHQECYAYVMSTQSLLQQLRDKGWSDTDIAEALGVDRATVYRWRQGVAVPQNEVVIYNTLRRLARRIGPPRRKTLAGDSPARERSLF
jgi:transcriptional regulator with XRE-family HTH domain